MNYPADGGGGGGDLSLVLDPATVGSVATRLTTAAADLDQSGTTLPTGGDFGDAAAVVSGTVELAVGIAQRLMVEADTIGSLVATVVKSTVATDQEQAASFLVNGFGS